VDLLTLFQQLINGLSLGSLYALIAIGYTLVYGILRLINFAHGDLLMVAAYIAVMGVGLFTWPWPVAFGVGIGLTGLMGVLLEKGAYRPLRRAPRVVGGLGSTTGAVVAAAFFTLAGEWLRVVEEPATILGVTIPGIPGMRLVILSLALLLVIIYFRRGLLGRREFSWAGLEGLLRRGFAAPTPGAGAK
jgi:branched-subunit amino acid ABC-type transport system permease component